MNTGYKPCDEHNWRFMHADYRGSLMEEWQFYCTRCLAFRKEMMPE